MVKISGKIPSDEYWELRRREHRHTREQLTRENQYSRRLSTLYETTQDEIIRDIEADIGRFADAEGLSMAEARQRISKNDVRAYQNKAREYVAQAEEMRREEPGRIVRYSDFSDQANRELRKYNVTMRTNRLELLEARINLETVKLADKEEALLQEWLGEEALHEYRRQAGILGISVPERSQLEKMARAVVEAEFRSVEFSANVWQRQHELQTGIENVVRRTILRGEHPRESGKRLRKLVSEEFFGKNGDGGARYAANRLAITETARIQSSIGEQSAKDMEITQFVWIAEDSACDDCEELDGNVYSYDDPTAPRVPMHPFCKCAESPYMDRNAFEADLTARGL